MGDDENVGWTIAAEEWGEDLWTATLDVGKAFDRVQHSVFVDALLRHRVDVSTVSVLRRLQFGVKGCVSMWPGVDSQHFGMNQGVKQGDPLSSDSFRPAS